MGKKPTTLDVTIEAPDVDRIIKAQKENLQPVLLVLIEIIDAIYELDGNVLRWKPIRDEIERLKTK